MVIQPYVPPPQKSMLDHEEMRGVILDPENRFRNMDKMTNVVMKKVKVDGNLFSAWAKNILPAPL